MLFTAVHHLKHVVHVCMLQIFERKSKMTNTFTNQDFVNLLIIYFRNGENQREAARRFSEYYPERPAPSHQVVGRLLTRFMETGSVAEKKRSGRPKSTTDDNATIDVLASVNVRPKLSLRHRSVECGSSKDSVHRILKANHIRPYKTKLVHELRVGDPHRRLEFCHWASTRINEDPSFTKRLIFSDESTFVRHGQISRHWTYHWSNTNPHNITEAHTQYVEKLNVWCAIWDDVVIGPFFIQGNLTGQRYRELLNEQVWPVLEPLLDANADLDPYFMHDGAPAHNALIAREWLHERFPNRWVGREGPIPWPARSPDLTPMDFFLWGYLKNVVYPANSIDELRESIITNVHAITRNTLQSLQQAWAEKLDLCIANNGAHFEHL